MSKQGTIIVVDDNKGVLSAVKAIAEKSFRTYRHTALTHPHCPLRYVKKMRKLVLLDMNFSSGLNTGNEGLYWLHEIKKIHPPCP